MMDRPIIRQFLTRAVPALLVLAASVSGFCLWVWHDYTSPGPLAAAKTVILPRGARFLGIADALRENDVIAHPWLFALGSIVTGRTAYFKAGEYEFPAAISPSAAADLLTSGRTVQHRLTVPEGLTSAAIVAIVNAAPALDGGIDTQPPDGSLLPETYFYSWGDRRAAIVERMQNAFAKALAELWAGRDPDLPLASAEQAVVLASIVEKETGREDERPHVAAVYENRLRLGMKLQADPTVAYALNKGGGALDHILDHDDLSADSPYNTYLVKGLPPAPIANPGLAALKATLHPVQTEDLYFVADGAGGHIFAKTLAEQDEHIAAYRRLKSGEDKLPQATLPRAAASTPLSP